MWKVSPRLVKTSRLTENRSEGFGHVSVPCFQGLKIIWRQQVHLILERTALISPDRKIMNKGKYWMPLIQWMTCLELIPERPWHRKHLLPERRQCRVYRVKKYWVQNCLEQNRMQVQNQQTGFMSLIPPLITCFLTSRWIQLLRQLLHQGLKN